MDADLDSAYEDYDNLDTYIYYEDSLKEFGLFLLFLCFVSN